MKVNSIFLKFMVPNLFLGKFTSNILSNLSPGTILNLYMFIDLILYFILSHIFTIFCFNCFLDEMKTQLKSKGIKFVSPFIPFNTGL